MAWNRTNLLDLDDWTPADYEQFVEYALSLSPQLDTVPRRRAQTLAGRRIANLFFENSTRTRNSFTVAEELCGADVLNWSETGSSMAKGETLRDTIWTLAEMGIDAIVVRHTNTGMPYYIQNLIPNIPVINAGDGERSHPTQGLLDITTAYERLGSLKGKKLVILGDVKHSRVARSDIKAFGGMGARIVICGPRTLMPTTPEGLGAEYCPDPAKAVEDADIIGLLRLQRERQAAGLLPSEREYHAIYGTTKELLSHAPAHALIMHPAPINRGIEISSSAADGENSIIRRQVHNGVLVRMAIMYICLGNKGRL